MSRTSPAARANAARGVAVLAAPALLAALLSLPTAASAASNGRLFLSTGGNTPASSLFTGPSYTFGAAAPTLPGGSSETFYVLKGATGEYLAGYVTSGGQLYVLRYNGSTGTWSNEFNVAVGGDGLNGRRFDIAYEKSTGRAVVVYSASSAVPGQQLRYRTWDPLAQGWSGELTFGSGQLTGTANWVKLASRPGTNEIAVAVADNANRLTALIWNGSSWGSEPPAAFTSSVSYTAVAGDLDAYDLAYSSQTGDLLVAWADKSLGTNGTTSVCHSQYVRASKTWLGSVSVWANTTSIPNYANAGATPYQVIASADPLSDNVAVLWSRKKITGAELDARFWRPSGWDAAGVVTITTTLAVPAPNTRQFAGLWLASSGYSGLIVPYQDSGGSAYYGACLTNGGVFSITTAAVPVSTGAAPKPWIQATSDRVATERGLVLFADSTSSLWVKQVTLSYSFPSVAVGWQSADGGAALSAALSTTAAPAFGFDYDQPALTSVGDNSGVEAVTGKSAYGSPATGSAPLYDVDHFTLATAAGTDRVTYMVINVTSGYAGVSAIYVTDDAGTVLGSLSNPQAGIGTYGSNNVSVSYSSGGIPVTTSPKQYRLLVKPGFDWSLLPGSSYTVTAKVASVTATNLSVNADVSNGSVVVSHTPPANGRLFSGQQGRVPGRLRDQRRTALRAAIRRERLVDRVQRAGRRGWRERPALRHRLRADHRPRNGGLLRQLLHGRPTALLPDLGSGGAELERSPQLRLGAPQRRRQLGEARRASGHQRDRRCGGGLDQPPDRSHLERLGVGQRALFSHRRQPALRDDPW